MEVTAWPRDLLCVADLTCVALGELLDLAERMKADPARWAGALTGEALACFFDPPTSGLTLSAEIAADRLGMQPVVLPRHELEFGSGEPIGDIARTFSASASALLVHTFPDAKLREVARASTVPVINALSDEHRPCQALADLLTLRERLGGLAGAVLAFVGDARDGTVHSLMEAGALAEMDVRIACPPERRPSRLVEVGAATIAELHGGRLTITDDPHEAVAGADAVYTKAWADDTPLPRRLAYQVHPGLMRLAKPRAVFLHCLPARRGEEVSPHVIDGARSVIWQQAANRVPAEQALIYALVTAARAAA
jgi:ornithine carbamoyltransferase